MVAVNLTIVARMVKNPPANAADSGSIPPWSGKIPHAMEQLSLCATATESVL